MLTPLMELNIPLELNWKKGTNMPFKMSGSIQAVVIGDNVFVVGGYCGLGRATVMVYSLCTGSWINLPHCQMNYKHFSMAAVNDKRVLVGGINKTGNFTNVLGV